MKNLLARFSVVALLSLGGIVLALVALVWAWVALHAVEGPIIISFASRLGILRVGNPIVLYGMAIIACMALIMNALLARALEGRNRFLAGFVAVATFFLGFLIFIAYAAIITVNQ